jgi:hypothetical protein
MSREKMKNKEWSEKNAKMMKRKRMMMREKKWKS